MVLSGKDILRQVFDNKNINAWGMIGVLIAYIILFRLVHYALFLYSSLPFLSTAVTKEQQKNQNQPETATLPMKEKKNGFQAVAQSGELEMV